MVISKVLVPKYQFTEEELRKLSIEFKILVKNYLELSIYLDSNSNKNSEEIKNELRILKSIFYEVKFYIRELLFILKILERRYKISIVDDIFVGARFTLYSYVTDYAYKSAFRSLIVQEQEIRTKINNNGLTNIECLKRILEQIRRINSILFEEDK